MFSLRKNRRIDSIKSSSVQPLGESGLMQKLAAPIKNRIIGITLLISMILNIGIWILFYIFIKPTPEPIYLHYNIYFGIDLIGDWYKIYLIPLSGLVIILVNYFVSVIIYSSKRVFSYVVLSFTVIIHFFLVLAALLLTHINR